MLHADYDSDGRISRSLSEYGLGSRPPGAVVVANLDVDEAVKPAAGSLILDKDRARKSRRDGELIEVVVAVRPGTQASGEEAAIEVALADARYIRVFDAADKVVLGSDLPRPGQSSVSSWHLQLPLAFRAGEMRLRVEAIALPESPLIAAEAAARFPLSGAIEFRLVHRLNGRKLKEESFFLTIAPIIFPDPTLPAERLFICTMPRDASLARASANEPTVIDLEREIVASGVRVAIEKVDAGRHGSDAWLQDQFQTGYCYGARAVLPVVLHLPRLRSNTQVVERQGNLAEYVATFFPGRDRGLCQDFWNREVPFVDVKGRKSSLSFVESGELLVIRERVFLVWKQLREIETQFLEALRTAAQFVDEVGGDSAMAARIEHARDFARFVEGQRRGASADWPGIALALLRLFQVERLLDGWRLHFRALAQYNDERQLRDAAIDRVRARLNRIVRVVILAG